MLDSFIRKDCMLVTYRHPNARRGPSAWFEEARSYGGWYAKICFRALFPVALSCSAYFYLMFYYGIR